MNMLRNLGTARIWPLLCTAVAMTALVLALAAPARADFGNVPGTFFGITPGTFVAAGLNTDGDVFTQAGGHPELTTSFSLNATTDVNGAVVPDEDLRGVRVDLPPGVIGNPLATPQCLRDQFNTKGAALCSPETQIGVVDLLVSTYTGEPQKTLQYPIYNLVPPDGVAAQFGFRVFRSNVVFSADVRSDSDYGVTVTMANSPGGLQIFASKVVLWGVPADSVHDSQRYLPGQGFPGRENDDGSGNKVPFSVTSTPTAFSSNPTACGPVGPTSIAIRSWQNATRWVTDQAASPDVSGCEHLKFTPSLSAATSTSRPDAPTGLTVKLGFKQPESLVGLASAQLKDARVTLPEGMTINPASADGMAACGDDQLHFKDRSAVSCPEASKIGTVEATTPVLEEPLTGGVYLRPQNSSDPASGEMFRIALVLENAERGLSIRLPGAVKVDPATGRVVTEFTNNPQLPVSTIALTLKSGARAPLATPSICGTKTVDAELTAWSGQVSSVQSSFAVDCVGGLGGFAPAFSAGVVDPSGGAHSPFGLSIVKPDGNTALTGLRMELPAGLLASIKGNVGSQVGSVKAFAGPGSNPYMLPGKVFLEGSYGDAPFSLRAVVPAKAGPFDLGEVVVRQKVYVDPITAQVTVVSDPLPTIVKGVPVRLQRLEVDIDKPGFMVNPTSCAAKTIAATLGSATGQSVAVTNRFRVSDCATLDVKPQLGLTLSGKGQNADGGHPAISATLTQSAGQANLKKVRVVLPLSLALDPDNSASDDLCSFVEGSKPDPKCPASSVVGRATAVSPILNQPLTGPVYFTKNERKDPKSGRSIKTTPKLVIPLVGENGVKLTLTGTSDVVKDQLVTTFDYIPDAQVSSFKMNINGGKKGILVVSAADICKSTQVAGQQIDGQNGKVADADVFIQTPSCPLRVLSKKVGKTSVAVKVGGLGAGKVTLSGKGIKKTTKTISKSTVATISAKRTTGKPGKVKVSFDPAGAAKAKSTSK